MLNSIQPIRNPIKTIRFAAKDSLLPKTPIPLPLEDAVVEILKENTPLRREIDTNRFISIGKHPSSMDPYWSDLSQFHPAALHRPGIRYVVSDSYFSPTDSGDLHSNLHLTSARTYFLDEDYRLLYTWNIAESGRLTLAHPMYTEALNNLILKALQDTKPPKTQRPTIANTWKAVCNYFSQLRK